MVSYILALFSLLFILPLVYFLPIGFTKRGKLLLVGLSLVISMIGVYSQSLFEWWQTVLILLLLLIACTYILLNRLPDFLFTYSQEETESTLDWDESESYTNILPPEPSVRTNSLENEDLSLETEVKNIPPLVEIEQELHPSEIDSSLPVVEKEMDEIDLAIDEIGIYEEEDVEDESNPIEASNAREDEYDLNYMEELEKIISSEVSPELNQYAVATEEEIADTDNRDLLAEWEEVDFSFLEKEEETVSYDGIEDNQLLENRQEMILEAIDELEDILDADENTEIAINTDDEKRVSPLVNEVTHKIINNTFQQLQLMKKLVDPIEYENIVSRCLKEDMPLQEFYLIASLLIEHYMQQNEKTKLQSFFPLLKDKFKQESILLEQIIFLENHYRKK